MSLSRDSAVALRRRALLERGSRRNMLRMTNPVLRETPTRVQEDLVQGDRMQDDLIPTLEPKVLIPRPEAECPTDHQRCPTPRNGDSLGPLTRQIVPAMTCASRQADGYHKCGTCAHFTGQSFLGDGLGVLENSPSHFATLGKEVKA